MEDMFIIRRMEVGSNLVQTPVLTPVREAEPVLNRTSSVSTSTTENHQNITEKSIKVEVPEKISNHLKEVLAAQQFIRASSKVVIPPYATQQEREQILHDAELEEKYYRIKPTKVNPYIYDFVITPKNLCDENTHMLILVHSYHPYDDRRRAIRDTWGSVAKGATWPYQEINDSIKLAFVLGHHKDPGLEDLAKEEADAYDDIIQGSFMDSYNNMTLKSLLGLRYFMQHCSGAKYLLKSDDDMIVNLPYLLRILHRTPMERSIMGPLNRGAKVYRSGKWKLSREIFPFRYFPPYESGSAYVIDGGLVSELYRTAEYVPHIFIDDVYITGILGKILNVTHVATKGFAYWTDRAPNACDINHDLKITGTKMRPDLMRKVWKNLIDDVQKCSVPKTVSYLLHLLLFFFPILTFCFFFQYYWQGVIHWALPVIIGIALKL